MHKDKRYLSLHEIPWHTFHLSIAVYLNETQVAKARSNLHPPVDLDRPCATHPFSVIPPTGAYSWAVRTCAWAPAVKWKSFPVACSSGMQNLHFAEGTPRRRRKTTCVSVCEESAMPVACSMPIPNHLLARTNHSQWATEATQELQHARR